MYESIINEYRNILNEKSRINEDIKKLPKGYISKKNIKGKDYFYLQYRENGKFISKYIKKNNLEKIESQISFRKECIYRLEKLRIREIELKKASKLLSNSLFRELAVAKLSTGMDNISSKQRSKSISFANSMNSIEGISISNKTRENIHNWETGNTDFHSVFREILNEYEILKEV